MGRVYRFVPHALWSNVGKIVKGFSAAELFAQKSRAPLSIGGGGRSRFVHEGQPEGGAWRERRFMPLDLECTTI